MKSIIELKEKRMGLIKNARNILDKAESEKREMTPEETSQYDKTMADVDNLTSEITREERQVSLENDFQIPEERGDLENGEEKEVKNYENNYRHFLKTGEARDLVQGADDKGGYLSPETFVKKLIKAVDSKLPFFNLVNRIELKESSSLGVPTLEADVSDADWTAEVPASNIESDTAMTFGKRELKPNPLSKLVKVSKKLLHTSALPIDDLVIERLSFKIKKAIENGVLNGSGAGQPLGIFTASDNGIPTSRDSSSGNTATALTFDGLIEAKSKVKSEYNAVWGFHSDALKMLRKIKDTDGQYIWQPSVVLSDPDKILGKAYYESDLIPNVFTTGSYVGFYGDLSYYWFVRIMVLEIQRLTELFSLKNQVGFLAYWEADGMPVLKEAFTRIKLA